MPVLRPAILAAFVLGIVRSLASYAVPRVLGMPGNEEVLATYLYEMISVGFAPDYGKAAALGMSALVVAVVLIWLYRRPILDYWAEHDESLGAIVTHVLVHEIGHHFGFDDDDMEAIERAAG